LKNANELGIYDMSGNIFEWCSDWYGDYSSTSVSNTIGPSIGINKVIRGGDYTFSARETRISYRFANSLNNKGVGFRLVLP
jgi:formylglycine-generating enzyme required for sulfatase activity